MAQLLPMGKHILHSWPQIKEASCGLVPLAGPATVTTTGLQWDLGEAMFDSSPSSSWQRWLPAPAAVPAKLLPAPGFCFTEQLRPVPGSTPKIEKGLH